MNKIMAGEYIFSIADQANHQAFNMRTGTLHSAHVLPINEQNEFVIAKLIEANKRLTLEEGHLRIQNIFSSNDHYFVVYENLTKDSTNLLELMKVKNHLPENFVRKVAQLLLAFVSKMHSLNIAHRDLKLQNIFIYKHNGQWALKVKDQRFCEIDSKAFSNEHNGSPAYLAPEVTFCDNSYNSMKAEIYSVGVILFTLATGSYPFLGTCPKSLIQAIRSSEPSYPQYISPSLKSLLENLLNKNPTERMQARDALQHHWVLSDAENLKTNSPSSVIAISSSNNSITASGSSSTTSTSTAATIPSVSKVPATANTTANTTAMTVGVNSPSDQLSTTLVQSCQASSSTGTNYFVPAKHAAVY